WLMLMRKASSPASLSLRIISGLLLEGPMVARMRTLRARGLIKLVTAALIACIGDGSTGLRQAVPSLKANGKSHPLDSERYHVGRQRRSGPVAAFHRAG